MVLYPQFLEGFDRFWGGGLFGTDFFTDGGASSFGFRPNLPIFYPPYLVTYLLVDLHDARAAAVAWCILHVGHICLALIFCVLLARRFLGLGRGESIVFGALYGLSYQAAYFIEQTGFLFQLTLVPVVAYALCAALFARSWVGPALGSTLVVGFALTNYGPTMVAALLTAMSICAFVYWTRIRPRLPSRASLRTLHGPLLLIILAVVAVTPYYVSQMRYVQFVLGGATSLGDVALSGTFRGRDLVNAFSLSIRDYTLTEGRLVWGLIPTALVLIGVTLAGGGWAARIPRRMSVLLRFSLSIYVSLVLISLGSSTIFAEMFFYGVPVLGSMHLYQRFLIFGQIYLAGAVAASAGLIALAATARWRQRIVAGALVLFVVAALGLRFVPNAEQVVAVDPLTSELLLLVFALALLAFGRSWPALAGVAALAAATSLNPIFEVQRVLGPATARLNVIGHDPNARAPLNAALASGPEKALTKILYVVDQVNTYIPYNETWVLSDGARKYMNYYGYEPHLAMERAYLTMMGGWYGRFNRDWVLDTGADFVVWDDASAGKLAQLTVGGATLGPAVSVGGGLLIAPLRRADPPPGGRVVLQAGEAAPDGWRLLLAEGWQLANGRMVKVPGNSNHFGIRVPNRAGGDYEVTLGTTGSSQGSVSVAFGGRHGESIAGQSPGSHRRTFKADGINDLWVTATPDFDGAITSIIVRDITSGEGGATRFDNGVVRLQSDSDQVAVTDFETDWSKLVRTTVKGEAQSRLTYLLWPNRFLQPYLDGVRIAWQREGEGSPAYVTIPPGEHTLELRFGSVLVTAWKLTLLVYALVLALAAWLAFVGRASPGQADQGGPAGPLRRPRP